MGWQLKEKETNLQGACESSIPAKGARLLLMPLPEDISLQLLLSFNMESHWCISKELWTFRLKLGLLH